MSFTINVLQDTATPSVNALKEELTPGRLAAAIGPACTNLVTANFRRLGTNKRGWPTTNFWARAAKATSWSPDPAGVKISVNQIGVRQQWMGGEIRPVKARALTIPVSPLAYGHVASEFPGLFVLKTKKGSFLAQRDEEAMGKESKAGFRKRMGGMGGNRNNRQRARLNILFKLVSSVLQEPHPGVMPDVDEFRRTVNRAVVAAVLKKR